MFAVIFSWIAAIASKANVHRILKILDNSSLGPIAVSFYISVSSLGLLAAPWTSLIVCALQFAVITRFMSPQWSQLRRALNYIAPFALCITCIVVSPSLASLFLAGWFYLLSNQSENKRRWILTHFANAILMFELIDLSLLMHGLAYPFLSDLVHAFTNLIRDSYGDGDIVGLSQIKYRLLLFSIIAAVPIGRRPLTYLIPLVVQASIIVIGLVGRTYVAPWFPQWAASVSCILLISLSGQKSMRFQGIARATQRGQWVSRSMRICGATYFIFALLFGALACRSGTFSHDEASRPGGLSVLFLNDHSATGLEGDADDITHFARNPPAETAVDFDMRRQLPRYDKLAIKFLPALGYRTTVKSVDETDPNDFAKYRLVVLICLQNKLSSSQKDALYNCIAAGTTNLLIVGDHTDIRGVQEPFNDIMSRLGVRLNYDSVYPLHGWYRDIKLCAHPINGPLALAYRSAATNYSVGASLELDRLVTWPVIIAGDGFSDLGTRDAPEYGGLGDMRYTLNELRGGLTLVAERPFGKGIILAAGDTAFLQNSSITTNFRYVASVFDYLTGPTRRFNNPMYGFLGLLLSAVIVVALAIRFSSYFAVAYIMILVGINLWCTTLRQHHVVIERIQHDIILVDSDTASVHDTKRGIDVLCDVLDDRGQLVLASDFINNTNSNQIKVVILLGALGKLSAETQKSLIDYVEGGGTLVYASGYFDSIAQQDWLDQIGSRITPLMLGAGQQISLIDQSYQTCPKTIETWALELSREWSVVLTCYGKPIAASRVLGKGKVFLFSDSFAFLDSALAGETRTTNSDSYAFLTSLFNRM